MSSLLPVIAIVGLTATGKTKTAQQIIQNLSQHAPNLYTSFVILSADSRQVYKGLEITTGADIPAQANPTTSPELPYPFFQETLPTGHTISWHGSSILPPTQSWSVAEFRELAHAVFRSAQAHNQLVFVIGGTGLYHQAISDQTLSEMAIKPNPVIREKAETLSLIEMQTWLNDINPVVYASLNDSDRMNPRRLIRHIEKTVNAPTVASQPTFQEYQLHTYGTQLTTWEEIEANIAKRVKDRIEMGALQEVGMLDYAQLDPQARTTLGLREIHGFLESQYDLAALEQIWTLHEKQYAKRQLTWWKKRPEVSWFNPLDSNQVASLTNQIIEMTDKQ